MITAVELSRRNKPYRAFALDPGLMPGTGLARDYSGIDQFLWKFVLPFFGSFLPDTSSPRRSAATAAWILTTPRESLVSGSIIEYTRRSTALIWKELVFDPTVGAAVYDQSLELLDKVASL
jgi:hypothetical protein